MNAEGRGRGEKKRVKTAFEEEKSRSEGLEAHSGLKGTRGKEPGTVNIKKVCGKNLPGADAFDSYSD